MVDCMDGVFWDGNVRAEGYHQLIFIVGGKVYGNAELCEIPQFLKDSHHQLGNIQRAQDTDVKGVVVAVFLGDKPGIVEADI